MGTIAAPTSDDEDNNDVTTERTSLLPESINGEGEYLTFNKN